MSNMKPAASWNETGAEPVKPRGVSNTDLPSPSARSLLLTVLGELVLPPAPDAWTTALLRVLAGLGIEEHAGRQLLARAATAGWVERERRGRAVHWRLAPKGMALVSDGVSRSDAYLAGPPSWDGRWLQLFVTVPREQRATRNRLHGGLAWLGMGSPLSGVWMTPHVDRGPELADLVADGGLGASALALVGSVHPAGMSDHDIVRRAWDLTGLARSYEILLVRLADPQVPDCDDAVLMAYLRLLNVQQRLMRRDPFLPRVLLSEWIGRDGAAAIREKRALWGVLAHARWRQIVSECAPD